MHKIIISLLILLISVPAMSMYYKDFQRELFKRVRYHTIMPIKEKFMLVSFSGFKGQSHGSPVWDLADFYKTYNKEHYYIYKTYKSGYTVKAIKTVKSAITKFMSNDVSQGGSECKNIIIVANSWGSSLSRTIALWFKETYGHEAYAHAIIDGINKVIGAFNDIGPATYTLNYYMVNQSIIKGAPIKNTPINKPVDTIRSGFEGHAEASYRGTLMFKKDLYKLLLNHGQTCSH